MKRIIQLFAAIIFCTSILAQANNISFSGKLDSKSNASIIHLQNIDGIDISIPVVANNHFSFKSDSLVKGFYRVDEIGTVYICPGYQLTVQPGKEGDYIFNGSGAIENKAIRTAKKQLTNFLPVNKAQKFSELGQLAFYLEPSVFLQKLDSFQNQGVLLFNKSSDPFFQKYAALDLQFYGKRLLSDYLVYYGVDFGKVKEMNDALKKLDFRSPDAIIKFHSMQKAIYVKQMDSSNKIMLLELICNKWDRENDTLLQNSIFYRMSVEGFLCDVYDKKYKSPDDLKDNFNYNLNIKKLKIARVEIKNPYILAFFDYNLTGSILKDTKDTSVLCRYYNEYLKRASRQDYINNIKKIYNNNISNRDGYPAPEFESKNVSGKFFSLANLRGKFIYIDVWATLDEPCKAEMPYLNNLQSAYKGKNIEFVSISLDKQQDKNLWKKFVKTNNLKGIQLISDNAFETEFAKKMNINSIPRFILIDPTGKLISANALPPSNKELYTLLDKLL